MMPQTIAPPHLIDQMPAVRGRLSADAPIGQHTWFKTGGAAEVLFKPADLNDLRSFLIHRPKDVPLTVLGVGSNLLVRDGGIAGIVVRLGRAFAQIEVEGTRVQVGAGALDLNVALTCRDRGVAGLEFLSGVPGTIGGALRMNAGAFGGEMRDIVREVRVLDPEGSLHRLGPGELGFSYRHCDVPSDSIFVAALLEGQIGTREEIAERMAEITADREIHQPARGRTGGSTFVNPPGQKAWELIDRAGCRGLRRGDAMISEKHCNFLINTGAASAAEIEALGEEVRERVADATGVFLDWEIRRIGRPLDDATGETP
jgi:UDP-N-acetylmuramate dehydrogenase